MAKTFEKKDEYTLIVTKPKLVEEPSVTETIKQEYDYGFLLKQKEAITKQRDEMITIKEKELTEVEDLITEADKLGIIEETKEVKEEPTEEITKV